RAQAHAVSNASSAASGDAARGDGGTEPAGGRLGPDSSVAATDPPAPGHAPLPSGYIPQRYFPWADREAFKRFHARPRAHCSVSYISATRFVLWVRLGASRERLLGL